MENEQDKNAPASGDESTQNTDAAAESAPSLKEKLSGLIKKHLILFICADILIVGVIAAGAAAWKISADRAEEKRKQEETEKAGREAAAKKAEETKKRAAAEAEKVALELKKAEEAKKVEEERKKKEEENSRKAAADKKMADLKAEIQEKKEEMEAREFRKQFHGDITTIDGRTFKNCRIDNMKPSGIDVRYDGGATLIKFKDLDNEFKRKIGFKAKKKKSAEDSASGTPEPAPAAGTAKN